MAITPPAGFVERDCQTVVNISKVCTYTKRAGASEPTSYTVNFSTSAEHSATIREFSGVDSTTPVGDVRSIERGDVRDHECPAITAGAAGEVYHCGFGDTNGSTWTVVEPGYPFQHTRTGTTGSDRSVADAYTRAVTAPGPYSGPTFRSTDSVTRLGDGTGVIGMLLKPSGGGPPPEPECDDGINNDAGEDTLVDFPADPGCSSSTDTTETPNPGGGDDPGNRTFTGNFECGVINCTNESGKGNFNGMETASPCPPVTRDTSRKRDGAASGRFEVRAGCNPVDSGERSEVKHRNSRSGSSYVPKGAMRYIGFSIWLDPAFRFPASGQGHLIFWQIHPASGSPRLSL